LVHFMADAVLLFSEHSVHFVISQCYQSGTKQKRQTDQV
jgi:hypothetical protein